MTKISVVTDAVSDEHFFPLWLHYYGSRFGTENLFVITYRGRGTHFKAYDLGGVIELPREYDDALRAKFMSNFVTTLLTTYDGVVRVDTDEFLVPQGGASVDLKAFLDDFRGQYISARGFDLIAGKEEQSLDLASSILIDQRKYAYGNTPLNKICFTRTPVSWTAGFHSSTLFPVFADLYLFHLKFVDIDLQLKWRAVMTGALDPNSSNIDHLRHYYRQDYEALSKYRSGILGRPVMDGYDGLRRQEHTQKYLSETQFEGHRSGIYKTPMFHDSVVVKLPEDLRGAF